MKSSIYMQHASACSVAKYREVMQLNVPLYAENDGVESDVIEMM